MLLSTLPTGDGDGRTYPHTVFQLRYTDSLYSGRYRLPLPVKKRAKTHYVNAHTFTAVPWNAHGGGVPLPVLMPLPTSPPHHIHSAAYHHYPPLYTFYVTTPIPHTRAAGGYTTFDCVGGNRWKTGGCNPSGIATPVCHCHCLPALPLPLFRTSHCTQHRRLAACRSHSAACSYATCAFSVTLPRHATPPFYSTHICPACLSAYAYAARRFATSRPATLPHLPIFRRT